MSAPALAIEDLRVSYGSREVVRGLTLAGLAAGTVTALVGPNAAGKSTLLRAIAGLVPATGKIWLGEENMLSMPRARRSGLVGFMPQLLPSGIGLSVLETVLAALRVTSPATGEAALRARAVEVLKRLDALHLALEPLDRLSGGQRQIAALAQTLAPDPRLLLLDEPTSALDLRHQFQIMRLVRELAKAGRSVVVVLHDLELAAEWADTVVVLDRGRLHAAGPPPLAITPRMLREVYGVEAQVNAAPNDVLRIAIRDIAAHHEITGAAS